MKPTPHLDKPDSLLRAISHNLACPGSPERASNYCRSRVTLVPRYVPVDTSLFGTIHHTGLQDSSEHQTFVYRVRPSSTAHSPILIPIFRNDLSNVVFKSMYGALPPTLSSSLASDFTAQHSHTCLDSILISAHYSPHHSPTQSQGKGAASNSV